MSDCFNASHLQNAYRCSNRGRQHHVARTRCTHTSIKLMGFEIETESFGRQQVEAMEQEDAFRMLRYRLKSRATVKKLMGQTRGHIFFILAAIAHDIEYRRRMSSVHACASLMGEGSAFSVYLDSV